MEIVAFSHLRWNFVYQRPQHLLSRFARHYFVSFWEEPIYDDRNTPELMLSGGGKGVQILTPVLPRSFSDKAKFVAQRTLLEEYLEGRPETDFMAWYYTPMALRFSQDVPFLLAVYDCMDELSAFQGAPTALVEEERRLFERADVVFTGGASLYASKRGQHQNVHLFPSSIDQKHFAAAQRFLEDPSDQMAIPKPRIGFYGVLDERLDRDLLQQVAINNPDLHFVLIGPVAKITEDDLPRASNLHYLGKKDYDQLPYYLANWDAAMMPFALNASTRFISPTKTPEYLAAHKQVISTPIQDVSDPYGERGLVAIALDPKSFGEAIRSAIRSPERGWVEKVDRFLSQNSWDKTFDGMLKQIQQCLADAKQSSMLPDSKLGETVHV